MTKEEKLQLAGLLTWRKGVIPLLKALPEALKEVEQLRKEVAALSGKKRAPRVGGLGPMPKKEDRLPFALVGEEIEFAFEKVFRAALPEDEDVEEWAVSSIAKRLSLKYSAAIMGRALREMGVLQVQKKVRGKNTRLYRVVLLKKCAQ